MESRLGQPAVAGARPARRAEKLPEHLSGRRRATLCAADGAIVFACSLLALSSAPNAFGGAVFMVAVLCGCFALCGLYRRSYAVYAHDEAYYVCTAVLYAAVPVLLVLATIGQIAAGEVILALALCALGSSVLRIRLHLARRGGSVPDAGIATITPRAWHDRESPSYLLGKRIFDIVIALAVLPLALPVMLVAALAIALESRGSVFFKQRRVGRDGQVFSVIKFRTMRSDAGSAWARPGDNRITKSGTLLRRTSIDELPQLINVLKGEMSIVGPRPEMVEFAQRFAGEFPSYDQRHVVTPGITGWAQLYGKRNLQPDEIGSILPYDLFYVERASPLLDTAILLKTIAEVLFHRAV